MYYVNLKYFFICSQDCELERVETTTHLITFLK